MGPYRCGKTTTLNNVYDLLLTQGAVSAGKKPIADNDFSDIVTLKGKKIAIYTLGDYAKRLIENAANYANQNCDIMICACNKRFVTPFKVFKEMGMTTIVDKIKEKDRLLREKADINKARIIVDLIQTSGEKAAF